jgi:hypothetical protein
MEIDGDFPSCYSYDSDDIKDTHLNHKIKVKNIFGLDCSLSIYNHLVNDWYGKLSWIRLPIYPLYNFKDLFSNLMNKLKNGPEETFDESDIEKVLREKINKPLVKFCNEFANNLNNLNPNNGKASFEKTCEKIVKHFNYEIFKRNTFNKNDGDADLICTMNRSILSPFEQGISKLYVQIKKHNGTTDEYAVNQIINKLNSDEIYDASGCVMSLCDDFSEKAKELANDNDILLLNKYSICTLLLQLMLKEKNYDLEL